MNLRRLKKILYQPFCFVGNHTYERRFKGLTRSYIYSCEICSDTYSVHPSTFFRESVDEKQYEMLSHIESIVQTRFVLLEIVRAPKPKPIDEGLMDGARRPRRRVAAKKQKEDLIPYGTLNKFYSDLEKIRIKSLKDQHAKRIFDKYIM